MIMIYDEVGSFYDFCSDLEDFSVFIYEKQIKIQSYRAIALRIGTGRRVFSKYFISGVIDFI